MNVFSKVVLATALLSSSVAMAAPIKVASSFTIISDLVQQVGKDHVKQETIVGPNVDLHHFELTPSTMKELSGKGDDEVKLLFVNGLMLEPWLDRISQGADFKSNVVVVSEGVKPLKLNEAFELDEHDHEHHHDADGEHHHHDADEHHHHGDEGHHHHHHGEYDPHIWQDVQNTIVMVKNIENALVKADPDNSADYKKNAQDYIAQLTKLDKEVKDQFAPLGKEKRIFGTNHEAFAYFAKAYGFEQIPVGLGGAEPTASQLAKVMKELKEKNVNVVFLENTTNNTLIQQVAKDSHIKIGGTLIADALNESGETSSYIGMIKHNAQIIFDALK